MPTLQLSVIEVIILMLGAITLGITIHFFLISRKSLKEVTSDVPGKLHKELEVWKLKYFNDTELRDKELEDLRYKLSIASDSTDDISIEIEELQVKNKKLQNEIEVLRKGGAVSGGQDMAELQRRLVEAEENYEIYSIEAEEQRAQNKKLQAEIESLKKNSHSPRESDQGRKKIQEAEESVRRHVAEAEDLRIVNKKLMAEIELLRSAHAHPAPTAGEKPDYMEQLRRAQSSLMEHNEKINQLLGQIEIVKETEEKQQEILKVNEELSVQIEDLRYKLSQKEKEISNSRQKEHLTTEMNAMLDSAYNEFNILQSKMQKLEQQVAGSRKLNMEYEELRESYKKLSRDYEEQKLKYTANSDENRQLKGTLAEVEEQLRDAEFQRQQLQKRVLYLEELNTDMQVMVDANKKLESQLKRIGELESMLNVISEERDQLMQRKTNL
jgi:DNA repair exonuclease SbcCD ATPase subunit